MNNSTIEMMQKRYSLRSFSDKPITKEIKELIMETTMRAPTAGNMMLWSVLDITDQKIKNKLAVTCDNQPMIAKAPMVWIFLADYHKWDRLFECSGAIKEGMEKGIKSRKLDLGDLHLCLQDAIIAAQTAAISAESLGIGSCYIGDIIENWKETKEFLKLKPHTVPAAMLIFGYPKNPNIDRKLTKRCSKEFIFHENHYKDFDDQKLLEAYSHCNVKNLYFRKHTSSFMKEMNDSVNDFMDCWKKN